MAEAPRFTMIVTANGKNISPKLVGDETGVYEDDGQQRVKIEDRAAFVKRIKKEVSSSRFSNCQLLRNEKIDGKTVAVYAYTVASGNSEETIWIDKKNARPYRIKQPGRTITITYGN